MKYTFHSKTIESRSVALNKKHIYNNSDLVEVLIIKSTKGIDGKKKNNFIPYAERDNIDLNKALALFKFSKTEIPNKETDLQFYLSVQKDYFYLEYRDEIVPIINKLLAQ